MGVFTWKAVYSDGTCLSQFADGKKHIYPDIDRSKLVKFVLIDPANDKPVLVLNLHRGQKLIYRMRVALHYAFGPRGGIGAERVYLVGWQENRNGTNVQCIFFVFEDGHVEVRDRFNEHEPMFSSVKFRPEEKV